MAYRIYCSKVRFPMILDTYTVCPRWLVCVVLVLSNQTTFSFYIWLCEASVAYAYLQLFIFVLQSQTAILPPLFCHDVIGRQIMSGKVCCIHWKKFQPVTKDRPWNINREWWAFVVYVNVSSRKHEKKHLKNRGKGMLQRYLTSCLFNFYEFQL